MICTCISISATTWSWTTFVKFILIILSLSQIPYVRSSAETNSLLVFTGRYCVTNDESAIALNPPIEDVDLAKTVSKFYPTVEVSNETEINCNIGENDECTKLYYNKWSLENSLDGHINQEITDRRWEELKVYKTPEVDPKILIVEEGPNLTEENLVIPISIRAQEAHIFLCENNVTDSNCYWIMLQAWKGDHSAIRVCKAGAIYVDDFPDEPCSDPVVKIEHSPILSSDYWTNIKIMKSGSKMSVEVDHNMLLTTEHRDSFLPRRIFFHSKKGSGLWKLHKYNYIYTTKNGMRIGPVRQKIRKGLNCIALFVVMCLDCVIQVKFKSADTSNIVYYAESRTQNEKWKEEKIFFTSVQDQNVDIYFSPEQTGENSKPYWAVDSIRQCVENEYRVLESPNGNAPCQMLKNTDLYAVKNSNSVAEIGGNCPENTFGGSCIPCMALGNEFCGKFKYCELFNKQLTCYCSSGFHTNDCSKECSNGYYGHGCKKLCQNCYFQDCISIDGNCTQGCITGFTDAKCETTLEPILKEAPEIFLIQPKSCWVRITNFQLYSKTKNEPTQYKIEYKLKYKSHSSWMEADKNYYKFNESKDIFINGLQADTEYCVRALLYSSEKRIIYNNDIIPTNCFITTCTPYQYKNIHIDVSNTSATIVMNKTSEDMCRIHNYQYSLDEGDKVWMTNETVLLYSLKPFTKYTFKVIHETHGNVSKSFRTKEGVPSQIQTLELINVSSSYISLKWKEPIEVNGDVRYLVEYKLLRTKSCPIKYAVSLPYNNINTSSTQVVIEHLKPYSLYEVRVCAYTTAGSGRSSSTTFETEQSSTILQSEISNVTFEYIYTREVKFNIESVNCNNTAGPINFDYTVKCEDDWCDQKILSVDSANFKVRNLNPYTNYSFIVRASRNNRKWTVVTTKKFTTHPSIPNKVTDVDVVSKDETSFSFRWKPPFPPTGILAKYKIIYSGSVLEKDVEKCRLWPDHHCATITEGIEPRNTYTVQFFARNQVPDKYVNILGYPLTLVAESGKPDPPYGLKDNWTYNNDLKLSWKHPISSNGKLTGFLIRIHNGKKFIKRINSEEDYKHTYTFRISKREFKPCLKYTVGLITKNKVDKSVESEYDFFSPPPEISDIPANSIQIDLVNSTLTINTSELIDREEKVKNCNKSLYVLLSATEIDRINVDNEIAALKNAIRNNSAELPLKNLTVLLKIDQEELPNKFDLNNGSVIKRGSRVIFLFANSCYGKTIFKEIERSFSSEEILQVENTSKGLYALILLLLLVPLVYYAYKYKVKGEPIGRPRNRDIEEVSLNENESTKDNIAISLLKKQKTALRAPRPLSEKTKYSKSVSIFDFELYVKQSLENGELERQHALFPRGPTKPWEYGSLEANKLKNRYKNLVAYDHTRVKLAKLKENQYSDYINANYINGYKVPKAYIATQGPKSTTVDDFWRMVWQENVKHIVMLANVYEGGKKKVEKYWPNINEEQYSAGIQVSYISSEMFANYEHRIFKICYMKERREVHQLHFTSWPDHGVPLYPQSLVPFLRQMLKIPQNTRSPVIVHCSAGAGRTGTVILCDICLRMAAIESTIDFLANLEGIRNQRVMMVDNVEQYKLAHLVALECLFGKDTSIKCNDEMNKTIETLLTSGVADQLEYLSDTEWKDRAMDTVWNKEDMAVYPEKNRFLDIFPDKNYRICLKRYPADDESSSYINAVQVDGFRSPGRFIVSQHPLPNTIGDFWRMVWEWQCIVVISLNEIDPNDTTSCSFWPEKESEMNPVDYLTICHVGSTKMECWQIITVEVRNKQENESLLINVLAMNDWKPKDMIPNSIQKFLLFLEECDILSRQSNTIIVTCHDGVTASGLYIAATFLIDKMKLEHECDVCLAVRTIRHNRREFVRNEEQFRFLYKIAVMYRDSFKSYANFN